MTLTKLFPRLAACILALSLLGACQPGQGGFGAGPAATTAGAPPRAPKFTGIPYQQMSADARKITDAVAGHVAGQSSVQVPGVAFSAAAAQGHILPWLQSESFVLTGASLYRNEDGGSAGQSRTAGRLDYADSLGRGVGIIWVAHHRPSASGRVIETLDIAPAFDPQPRVHLSLIPVAALPGGTLPAVTSYADLADIISRYAVDPSRVPAAKAEYYIVLSTLDPISTTAQLDLRISSQPAGIDGYDKGQMRTTVSNWGLTVARGTLDLSSRRDLYAKAVFTPGRETETGQRNATLIGVFALRPGGPAS